MRASNLTRYQSGLMARSAKPSFMGSNPIRVSNMPKSYFIKTFGCQYNKADSQRIRGDFEARGYKPVASWQECDELVINTCAVRQSAEDKVRGFLYNVSLYCHQPGVKKPKIILTGCMTHHGQTKLLEMMPMLDAVLPVGEVGFNQAPIRDDQVQAYVPISTGCNSFCAYCIVPYSRGREKSRSFDEIMAEIKSLVADSFTEITLLGMNVNSWGLEKVGIDLRKRMMRDDNFSRENLPDNQSQYLRPKTTPPFVRLLQAISAIKQIKIIRFMTSNPWDFHNELIEEIGQNKKIDRYVHLPLQSGSNAVLSRMNRGYTREKYLEVVAKLRQVDKNIVLGTDIIVGFPGETAAEFKETLDLVKQVGFKVGFVARYSPRPGTVSWRLYQDDVPASVKKRRWEVLDKLINKDNLQVRPKVV